jgi:hypothetical protein
MRKSTTIVLALLLTSFSVYVSAYESSLGKEAKITPEEVVARHVESIGNSKVLRSVKSRCVYGSALIHFTHRLGNIA